MVCRDSGQDCAPHLVAWAVLERCLSGGLRQFRDTLALEAVMERWVLDGTPGAGQGAARGSALAATSGSSMDAMMASFPMMSVAPAEIQPRDNTGSSWGGKEAAEGGEWRAASQSWVPTRTAEVLRIMAPLTVTVHHDLPLLSSSVEIDMCLLCRV